MTRVAAFRQLLQRFAFLGLGALAFVLMMLGKADSVVIERVRTIVEDAVTPIMGVLVRPAATIAEAVDNVRALANIRTENAALREANERLLQWQTVARQLEAENNALRGLLDYQPSAEASFITARVVADSGGSFIHSVLINAGSREGIKKGQVAMTGEGVVGRVTEVGLRSARVLLLTDMNSRIPVVEERSRLRAILAGDNTDRPKLTHLLNPADLSPGDRLVTAAHGGAYPPGLPVGTVGAVADGIARIEPFMQRHKLEYLRVVDYGLAGAVVPQGREAPARDAPRESKDKESLDASLLGETPRTEAEQ